MKGLLQWPRYFLVLTLCHNSPQRTKDLTSLQWPQMSLLFSHFQWPSNIISVNDFASTLKMFAVLKSLNLYRATWRSLERLSFIILLLPLKEVKSHIWKPATKSILVLSLCSQSVCWKETSKVPGDAPYTVPAGFCTLPGGTIHSPRLRGARPSLKVSNSTHLPPTPKVPASILKFLWEEERWTFSSLVLLRSFKPCNILIDTSIVFAYFPNLKTSDLPLQILWFGLLKGLYSCYKIIVSSLTLH